LDPADAVAATVSGEVKIIDSRPMGGAYVADQLWARLGVAAAIAKVAKGRPLDAAAMERALFMMVANRLSVKPLTKLAGVAWAEERVYIDGIVRHEAPHVRGEVRDLSRRVVAAARPKLRAA
jgi:hypothetical protein